MKRVGVGWALLAALIGLSMATSRVPLGAPVMLPAIVVAFVAATDYVRWAGLIVAVAGAALFIAVAFLLLMTFGMPHGGSDFALGWVLTLGISGGLLGLVSVGVGLVRLFGRRA
jgi:hypothetical protein